MQALNKRQTPQPIQGTILKCNDGRWEDTTGITPSGPLLVMAMTRYLRCWHKQQWQDTVGETADEPLPDPDELNSQIPKEEWEPGLDGQPRPPWARYFATYLLDPTTGEVWTHINSTFGARIAFERLQSKFKYMRALRGLNVVPLVELTSAPMKTKFGEKLRPEFRVVEWRDLGGTGEAPLLDKPHGAEQKPRATLPGKKAAEPSVKEELNDSIPW
jgi:hypothetical protein